MQIANPFTRINQWHVSHDEAMCIAIDAADTYGIAQTIYLTDNGFAVTNAMSSILRYASVTSTILPSRYFI